MNNYREKLMHNLLIVKYHILKKDINLNDDVINYVWFFLNDYNLKIIKIQRFWRKFISCNIHVNNNYIILEIIKSFPHLECKVRLLRQSSMSCPEWCCAWKNGFISPMLPEFRKLKNRINIGTLITKLLKNRLVAYGHKTPEELNMYPMETFIY
tara:strand:+ start:375 stop:836 length:462 start_codon:yes stop_codon:yes gene_type:complete